ncbi:MAG TPA: SRPBCC domain-containing protein [Vicinamibacterales bacterium]
MNADAETTSASTRSSAMGDIHIVNEYAHPIEKVWRALTDPELIPRWTKEGLGGRTQGFAPVAGTTFWLVAKPQPFWRGFVECEVIEVRAPSLLRYSWVGDEGDRPTLVAYQLEAIAGGTRFTFDHTGFVGVGGFIVSRVLRRVRRKMLGVGLPAVLNALDDPA